MFTERTSVGLDVHARSVAAAAIDGVTGELFQARLTPSHEHIRSWLPSLPGPVAVAYEAGPTGFGLYRALTAAGIRCEVAAPSKLQKPAGDRVKTDAKDAVHLARLLRLDEVTAVAIPTVDQEAARDLVRAREDCRGDLMRARHRLSKLLLRHGIVYYGGDAWTGKHDAWLRQTALAQLTAPATRLTFDSDYETVLTVKARRDRLDAAIERDGRRLRVHPARAPAGLPARDQHPDRVRAGGRDRRLAPVHRQHHRLLRRAGALASTPRGSPGSRARSPRPATPTCAGCWSRPPGTTAPATGIGKTMRDRWELAPAAARARGDEGNRRLHHRWVTFIDRRKRPRIANVAIARELAGWCWSLAVLED